MFCICENKLHHELAFDVIRITYRENFPNLYVERKTVLISRYDIAIVEHGEKQVLDFHAGLLSAKTAMSSKRISSDNIILVLRE